MKTKRHTIKSLTSLLRRMAWHLKGRPPGGGFWEDFDDLPRLASEFKAKVESRAYGLGSELEYMKKLRAAMVKTTNETLARWYENVDLLHARMSDLSKYRAHLRDCDVNMTEFCTCGLRETMEAVQLAMRKPPKLLLMGMSQLEEHAFWGDWVDEKSAEPKKEAKTA